MVKFVRITSLFTLINHGQNSKIESFPPHVNFTGYLRFMRKIWGVPEFRGVPNFFGGYLEPWRTPCSFFVFIIAIRRS